MNEKAEYVYGCELWDYIRVSKGERTKIVKQIGEILNVRAIASVYFHLNGKLRTEKSVMEQINRYLKAYL